MATIDVALVADDSDFQKALRDSIRSLQTLASTAKTSADTTSAAMDKTAASAGRLDVQFGRLRNFLIGGAFVAFARSSMMLADQLDDLKNLTGLTTNEITKFASAVQFGGGQFESAGRGLQTLFEKLDSAVRGSKEAQESFARVGITLNDLATLSERDILQKTVQGIAKIGAETGRAEAVAVAMDLLGKAARGVTIDEKFVTTLMEGGAEADLLAERITQVADANERFEKIMLNLKIAFIETFGPAIEYISELIQKLPIVTQLMKALGVVIVAIAVGSGFRAIVTGFGMAARGALALKNAVVALFAAFRSGGVKGVISSITGAAGKFAGGPTNKTIAGARDVASLGGAAIAGGITAAALFGGDEVDNETKALDSNTNARARRNVQLSSDAKKLADEARRRQQSIDSILREADAFKRSTAEMMKNLQTSYDMIGVDEDIVKVQEAGAKVTDMATREIEKLKEQRARLLGEENSAAQVAAIDSVIATIQRQAEEDRVATEAIVRNGEIRKRAYETEMNKRKEIMDIVAGGANFREQLAQQQQLADAENELVRKKLEMQFEMERANQVALLELRKKYAGQEIPQVELDALEKIKAARAAELELNQRALTEDFDRRRTFIYGWTEAAKQAVNSLQETVADQGAYAKRIFDTITGGFTNSIMKFVETGKLSFKDLFKSLMMEIIKMQMNKLFLSIFGKGGPLGSIFAGLFADGGYIPGGKYGIVGERGPELVRGPANVVGTDQTAALMSGGGGMTQVTYNISAVDSRSFKDLVASDPAFIYNVTRAGARRIPR